VVVCLVRGADLHMAQRVPLPLTVSCSCKIQIGLTFLVPAHLGSPGQRAVKRVCVYFTGKGGQENDNRGEERRDHPPTPIPGSSTVSPTKTDEPIVVPFGGGLGGRKER